MDQPEHRRGHDGQTPDGTIAITEVTMHTVTVLGRRDTVRVPLIGYAVQRGKTTLAVFVLRTGAQQFADAVHRADTARELPPPDAEIPWPPAVVARLAALCTDCGAIHVVDPALRAALALPKHR